MLLDSSAAAKVQLFEIRLVLPNGDVFDVPELGRFDAFDDAEDVAGMLQAWLHLGVFGSCLRSAVRSGPKKVRGRQWRKNMRRLLWLPNELDKRGFDPAHVEVKAVMPEDYEVVGNVTYLRLAPTMHDEDTVTEPKDEPRVRYEVGSAAERLDGDRR